jgi:hypothetical protein
LTLTEKAVYGAKEKLIEKVNILLHGKLPPSPKIKVA